mmetsp:Transcript_15261/g.46583  ORF Transcript_15261/g.46583 Transcript_15261/m.46583 type:complete len:417 (-) Transcript_15261:397-1647(-)
MPGFGRRLSLSVALSVVALAAAAAAAQQDHVRRLAWKRAQERASALIIRDNATAVEANCTCFSFCHPWDVHSMFSRLPVVEDTSSPWYAYLKWVYGGTFRNATIQLPVDLSTFGAIRLPGSADAQRLHMPVVLACDGYRNLVPACTTHVCSRWLGESKSSWRVVASVEKRAKGGSGMLEVTWQRGHRKMVTSYSNATMRKRFRGDMPSDGRAVETYLISHSPIAHEPVTLSRLPDKVKDTFPDGSIVEVLRHVKLPEGLYYGCWYVALTKPYTRGTGVFMNVGRVLTVQNPLHILSKCAEAGFHRLHDDASLGWYNWTVFARRKFYQMWDNHFALCLLRLGYDTAFVTGSNELLDARPYCSFPGQQQPMGACPAAEAPLSTGWTGTEPCTCVDEDGSENLNCGIHKAPVDTTIPRK